MRKQSQLKLQNNNNKGRSRSTSLLGGGRTVDPGSFDPPGAFCRGMVKTKGKSNAGGNSIRIAAPAWLAQGTDTGQLRTRNGWSFTSTSKANSVGHASARPFIIAGQLYTQSRAAAAERTPDMPALLVRFGREETITT